MKDKVLTFIIGLLVGAIITTGVFLIIDKNSSSKGNMKGRPDRSEMGNFTPGEMPSGGRGGKGQKENSNSTDPNSTDSNSTSNNGNSQMPEPPSNEGKGPQGNGEEPPAKPEEVTQSNATNS